MLGKVWIVVGHCDYDSGVDRQCISRIVTLDIRAGYDCRGEGFVDCWKDSTWDCWLRFSGSVPVLVVHTGAVSVLDMCER